jgi:hypothetical protein
VVFINRVHHRVLFWLACTQLTVELYRYDEITMWSASEDGGKFVFWLDDSHAIILVTPAVRLLVLACLRR